MFDVGVWLASGSPAPAADLSHRISTLVGGRTCAAETAMAALFIDTAADLLTTLRDERTSAFDLLTADALITYAMEASAGDQAWLDAAARLAIQTIGAVPGRGGQA
jgi:hypothetical protein